MREIIMILAVIGLLAFVFYMTTRLDHFLGENKRKSHSWNVVNKIVSWNNRDMDTENKEIPVAGRKSSVQKKRNS